MTAPTARRGSRILDYDDWVIYWADRRLGFRFDLPERSGSRGRLQQRGEHLPNRFGALVDHDLAPCMLHGELWGGNLDCAMGGAAVILDLACR
ncbi:MAG: fructosamine kinase family protein [Chromatiaceae bacterium]|nr:fructosamine kinase family protein [Chromatiaceae bacterium]